MKQIYKRLNRAVYTLVSLVLIAAVAAPLFPWGKTYAAQVTDRSIELSDSAPSGGSITSGEGSGTSVTYRVTFTTASSAQSLVIDFCSDSPIIGDTCTAPTSMDASSASASTVSGGGAMGGWTVTAGASQVKLAGGASQSAGTQIFDITGVTNPSTTGTFYARVYTFSNGTFGTYSSAASPGNYVDYGGVALSTAEAITITARVQEQITFCTSAASLSATDCSSATTPAVTLGHGSPTAILDSSQVDTGNVYTQLSTNATSGATIRMVNSNSCGGLSSDGGTTCDIPAVNSGASTPAAITAGTAAFGVYVASGSGGTGTITANANYNDGNSNHYGMDTTSGSGANVTGTFGDAVASSSAPVDQVNNTYTFAATASLTTPAGIYTANIDLIATGTF